MGFPISGYPLHVICNLPHVFIPLSLCVPGSFETAILTKFQASGRGHSLCYTTGHCFGNMYVINNVFWELNQSIHIWKSSCMKCLYFLSMLFITFCQSAMDTSLMKDTGSSITEILSVGLLMWVTWRLRDKPQCLVMTKTDRLIRQSLF